MNVIIDTHITTYVWNGWRLMTPLLGPGTHLVELETSWPSCKGPTATRRKAIDKEQISIWLSKYVVPSIFQSQRRNWPIWGRNSLTSNHVAAPGVSLPCFCHNIVATRRKKKPYPLFVLRFIQVYSLVDLFSCLDLQGPCRILPSRNEGPILRPTLAGKASWAKLLRQ